MRPRTAAAAAAAAAWRLAGACCAAAVETQKKIEFTFVYVDGQLVPVAKEAPGTDGGGISRAVVQAIFFVLLFLVGFAGSAMLIATVWSSVTLYRLPFNLLLVIFQS